MQDFVNTYAYNENGNRTLRYVWTDANSNGQVDPGERSQITEYQWDHRNRLVSVIQRETDAGPALQTVEHTYDYLNRWVTRSVDPDGDGPLGSADTYFVYDGVPSPLLLRGRRQESAERPLPDWSRRFPLIPALSREGRGRLFFGRSGINSVGFSRLPVCRQL